MKTAKQLIARDKSVTDVYRVIEVTLPTHHRWWQQCRSMQAEEARQLTQLEKSMLKGLAERHF